MTTQQPEALRLAEIWDAYLPAYNYKQVADDSAAELRRLHESNEELLSALQDVSWASRCGDVDDIPIGTQLYTTPPQRPWAGLTEFQFAEIYNAWNDTNGSTPWGLNQALEAKLRKLNK